MHDPMVVAFDVKVPIPKRWRFSDPRDGTRWALLRGRYQNPEHLGQPMEPWWRPKGWHLIVAGRAYRWRTVATIWHVEPGGHDSGEVCKHYVKTPGESMVFLRGWRWHVWHWRIQIPPLQDLRARLFDRCVECGRKGRPNVSHQWHGKHLGWWKFRSREGLYHRECSALGSYRGQVEEDKAIIRHLIAALRLERDVSEAEIIDTLTGSHVSDSVLPFHARHRLTRMLGYERDDSYDLVKQAPDAP